MKNVILLFLLCLVFGHLEAQFTNAYGEPGQDFQATQIRVLDGNTYVSGWFFDPSVPATAGNTEEGVIFRLDGDGVVEWVYKLSPQTPAPQTEGTRIYDFDFNDDQDRIVFVGSTGIAINPAVAAYRDSECIVGMVNLNNGNSVFEQSYNFRNPARELFRKIANDPNPNNTDSYFISGMVNDPNTGPGTIDNYIGARATITNSNVMFSWINEHNYISLANTLDDQEMARMKVLTVAGQSQIVFAGIDDPGPGNNTTNRNDAHINFHDENGVLLDEIILNQNGVIHDVVQMGNLLIVVGQLRANNISPSRPFITGIDLNTKMVVTNSVSFPTTQMDRFSRVEVEPNSGDIYVVGERLNNQNSVVCRFRLAPFAATLTYIDNVVLDFGNDEIGTGLLTFDNQEAFWADSRSGFGVPLNPTDHAVAVVRTDLNFLSCESVSLELEPIQETLTTLEIDGLIINPLNDIPDLLQDIPGTICGLPMCGPTAVGVNYTLMQVPHGSNSEYVTLTDFNQDGWMDFAVPDLRYGTTPQFSISENNQNLTFTNFNSMGSNPSYISDGESMEFRQLDGINGPDIVLHRQGSFQVYTDQLNGNFTLEQTFQVTTTSPPNQANLIGIYRSDFDLVDHNGDQIPDLVITGATTGSGVSTPRIAIFLGFNTNTPPFFDTTPNNIITLDGLAAISYWETKHDDINGDGDNDLVMGQAGYNGTTQSIFGYLNNGTASIFPATPNLNYETPTGFIWPRGLEFTDITGNGNLDLVAAMQAEELVSGTPTGNGALIIARNVPTSAGNYSSATLQWQVFNIPGQPVGIDIGDIDLDGDDDVVVAVHYPSPFVRIYHNSGNGNFTSFTDYATPGGYTTEVQIADFNNDCCLDIVTAQWHGNSSYVLINNCESSEFIVQGQVRCEDDPCNFLGGVAPNQVVSVSDGSTTYYAITDNNGEYALNVPPGTYDVTLVNGNYGSPVCAFNTNVYANDAIGITPGNIAVVNFAMEEACKLDVNMVGAIVGTVGANTCPFIATPCEDLIWEYCIEIENNSCAPKNIGQVVVNLPNGIDINSIVVNEFTECGTQTQVSFGTANAVPYTGTSNLFGSTFTYNTVDPIPAGGCYNACVQATFNGGFTLPIQAEVTVGFGCGSVRGRETDVVQYQDTCSCDPNLKLAYFPQDCGTPAEVLDQPIEYTIQFSNIGQTPAYYVLIEDQLDANLDWSTFQWIGSSHPFSNLTLVSGLLSVDFNTIVLQPAAAGWIKFSVKPLATTPHNTTISNSADITFDSNAPVPTNTATTQILFSDAEANLQFNATEYCVGDSIYIDYLWNGDAAWLNFTQDGTTMGQNIPAPPSGTQIAFHISDFTYVGTWDYELVAIDSLTGCTDTARVTIVIDDCVCEEVFTGEQTVSRNCKGLNLEAAAHHQLSGSTITLWDVSSQTPDVQIVRFGDGTELVFNPAQSVINYTYSSPGYYVIEYVAVIMLDDGSCCIDTYYIEVEVPEGEGGSSNGDKLVNQKEATTSVHIYPNPATREVTIQADVLQGIEETLHVQVYTADGSLLQQYELLPDYNRLNLQLGKAYQGLVFVRVVNQQGELLLEERFVKVD